GWDPVENVSFLPWLLGTAFVHSVMVVERRGKLRAWTLGLVIAAFAASIFGTFVVRSGVLSSVHSFAESEIGPLFLTFFGVVTLATLLLVFWRLPALRDEKEFDSVLSRESGFLVNNLIIVGIAFATFWGTIYPLASEALQGEKITVGPAFYTQVNGPLFLALVLLMGVGPLLAWRKSSLSALWRNLRIPLLLSAALAAILALLLGSPVAALAFGASLFALAAVLQEYLRGVRVRRWNTGEAYPAALVTLVSRNRQRYGGYLVHVGTVVLAIGIIASQGFQQQLEVNLPRGETATVGPYSLTYLGTEESRGPGMDVVSSRLAVTRDGVSFGSAIPRTSYHFNWENQPRTNVAILTSLWDDLYVFQAGVSESSATFAIFVNPLVSWVWAGGTILLLGFLVAAWPERQSARIPVWEPLPGAIAREA
ncbi:MAG: cytochrome c biogenesis protein CcsA, partial [Chloroflexi bacterium]|nr:cytochrome c biogenesis protein CcsA [Chloroflexota bacterium]